MKRINVFIICVLFCSSIFGQKGNNQIGLGADVSMPSGQLADYFRVGLGAYAKALFGVGKSGQVTITSAYSTFNQLPDPEVKSTINMIPLLIGYRANFNGFFAEPQIGYARYGGRVMTIDGASITGSSGSVMWAAGIGYVFNNNIEVSARYQSGSRNGSNINVFGLRLGYDFSLNSSKK